MKRWLLYIAISVSVGLMLLLAWPSLAVWNAKRLGANKAAEEASNGRFEFVEDSGSSLHWTYPGTNGCLLPGEEMTVTDLSFGPSQAEQERRKSAFAVAHNQYLVAHFPKQMAARCRRRAGGS